MQLLLNMFLKLITINIEGSKHLDKVLAFLKKENPDVVCLQEVFAVDFPKIKNELKMEGKYFSTSNKASINKYTAQANGQEGVALLTRLPHDSIKGHYYVGKGDIPLFTDPYAKDRVLVHSTIESQEKKYTIGTTHFTWTPDGQPDKKQWQAFHSLMNYIKKFDNFVLCGDLNAPRGREMFAEFTKYFTDHLPLEINSTLDPKLHKAGHLELVVDTIFSTSYYTVHNIKTAEGISDHKAIIGEITEAR